MALNMDQIAEALAGGGRASGASKQTSVEGVALGDSADGVVDVMIAGEVLEGVPTSPAVSEGDSVTVLVHGGSPEVVANSGSGDAAQAATEAAQTDATQAISDAASAQSDATQAISDAASAQEDATQALADADAAKKTATNFMDFQSGTGLIIGDRTGGSFTGAQTILDADSLDIINGDGDTVASYGTDVSLGVADGAAHAVYLCKYGSNYIGIISVTPGTDWQEGEGDMCVQCNGTLTIGDASSSRPNVQAYLSGNGSILSPGDPSATVRARLGADELLEIGSFYTGGSPSYETRAVFDVDEFAVSGSPSFSTPIPVSSGGTGASTAAAALTALGALSSSPRGVELMPDSGDAHGGFVDFHFGRSSANYTARIIENASGNVNVLDTLTVSGRAVHGATTLYENSSGSASAITLDESAADFDFLEIFFALPEGSRVAYSSVKVESPDGRRISMMAGQMSATSGVFKLTMAAWLVSGTSLTPSAEYQISIGASAVSGAGRVNPGTMCVYRVLGWK